jgi:hypothetical protein
MRWRLSISKKCKQKGMSPTDSLLSNRHILNPYGNYEDSKRAGALMNRSFVKVVLRVMSLWDVAQYAKCEHEGCSECSTRCHLKMWALGMQRYWDMWNVDKPRMHWNYVDKCNNILEGVRQGSFTLVGGSWMHTCAIVVALGRADAPIYADHSKWMEDSDALLLVTAIWMILLALPTGKRVSVGSWGKTISLKPEPMCGITYMYSKAVFWV